MSILARLRRKSKRLYAVCFGNSGRLSVCHAVLCVETVKRVIRQVAPWVFTFSYKTLQ